MIQEHEKRELKKENIGIVQIGLVLPIEPSEFWLHTLNSQTTYNLEWPRKMIIIN